MGKSKPFRRSEIARFIVDHKIKNNGDSPTVFKIAEQVGLSKTTAYHHLKKLEKDGFLEMHRNGIKVLGGHWEPAGLEKYLGENEND